MIGQRVCLVPGTVGDAAHQRQEGPELTAFAFALTVHPRPPPPLPTPNVLVFRGRPASKGVGISDAAGGWPARAICVCCSHYTARGTALPASKIAGDAAALELQISLLWTWAASITGRVKVWVWVAEFMRVFVCVCV